MPETKFRHEYKYICTELQMACIKSRIRSIMTLDKHTGPSGRYSIRSLYFDDYADTCCYENENGTDPREKFRIRIYNHSGNAIKLELKKKEHGKTQKLSCPITSEQCRNMMAGRLLPDSTEYPPILQKFCLQSRVRLLRPKVIVEYNREPYVYRNGNVRVTFDKQIRSSNALSAFLEEKVPARHIMPTGYHILEVKYDGYLPDYIYQSIQIENLQFTAFSKYYLCRKYMLGGANSYGI